MFTGLVEAVGSVVAIELHTQAATTADARLAFRVPFAHELTLGESVAVNGVCLTVTDFDPDKGTFSADAMPETLRVTTLGQLRAGDTVNLERALPANGRLGGHIVAGHVDAVGQLLTRTPGPRWDVLRFSLPAAIAPLVALKGSITVSGVSLTVSAVGNDFFEVSLIPQTLADTTLGALTVGGAVNLEADLVARYLARMQEFASAAVTPTQPLAQDRVGDH